MSKANSVLDRVPPHDMEAERGALGSILLNPPIIDEVSLLLRAGHFYDDSHRVLYDTMWRMNEAAQRIDITLLTNRLKRENNFERIGGAAALGKIASAVPNAAHAVYYARIVLETALLRELINSATDNLSDAYHADGRDAGEIIERAEGRMFEVSAMRVANEASIRTVTEVLRDTLDTIDARTRGEVSGGLSTGFCEVDALVGGLRPGNVIVIGARPGQGKTTLAMQMARRAAEETSVLFFSLEMSDQELAERMLAQETGTPLHRMRSGVLTTNQRQEIVAAAGRLSQLQFRIEDRPNRSANAIAAICRREHRRRHSLGMIVVDYLQLVQPENPRDPRQEQVAKMSRRFKLLARELDIPVVIVCQLNRESDRDASAGSRRPKLSQLRESGAIEQDADVVLLLYHAQDRTEEDLASDPRAEVIVAKNRMGPTGVAHVLWQAPQTRFVNMAQPRDEGFAPYDDSPELF